jgi:putative nucleotidyltransferase with HDIG domain
MEKIKVLLVDDEPSILHVVQRAMQATIDCDVSTAPSGDQALQIMEEKHFDVVVSDISMPGMDGSTLINVISELYPKTMRLIFSARSGGEIGLKTAGSAHQFYLKPTDISLITKRIKGILKLRGFLPAEGLDQIVSHIKSLPSIPAVYTELEKELENSTVSTEVIGKIIEKDIAMSAKVLQLVNSAFFGMRERVTRPSQAAVLLGGEIIKSLLLGLHIFTGWTKKTVPYFSIQELWGHSLNVASNAQEIASAEGCDKKICDEIYSAGLFHDIGKIILADNLPESCEHIQKMVGERGITLLQAEKKILGATHAEAGAYLMALWGFPDSIVNACAFHHQPHKFDQAGFNSVAAVHVANVFSYENELSKKMAHEPIDKDYIAREGFENKMESWRIAMNK